FPLPCHYGLPLGSAWIQDGGEDAVDSPDGRPIFHISARNGASMPVLMSNLTARSPNMRVIQGMSVPAKAMLKNTKVSRQAPAIPPSNGARHHERWRRR